MSAAPAAAAALEAALRDRGLLPAQAPPLPPPEPGRPWFVGALLGLAGWLAGLCALGFVASAFRPSGAGAFLAIGLVLLGVSFGLYRVTAGAFGEQLALAFSVAGHTALAFAAYDATDSGAATAAAVALSQAGWVLVVPNSLARVLSTVAGCAAAGVAANVLVGGEDRGRWRHRPSAALAPALLGWLVVWGPAAALARRLVATEARWIAAGRQRLARPVLTGLVVALALATPSSHPVDSLALWGPESDGHTSWLALWPLLAVAAAGAALWLGHRLRSRALVGAAAAGALLHVFHFYMALGVPLRVKAAIMVALGALLLGARAALDRAERRRGSP